MRDKISSYLTQAKFFVADHSLYLSIGIFSVLLVGLFLTVWQVSQQQESRSRAQAGLIPHENCSASKDQVALDADERRLFSLVNQYRQDNGLEPLIDDEPLDRAAAWLASDMVDSNKFSHTDSLGRDAGKRVVDCGFYGEENQVLENIAKGQTTPEDVFNGWKKSATHNETMLNENMIYAGIGKREIKSDSSKKGKKCKGKNCDIEFKTYYWVMNLTAQPDLDEESGEEECYFYEDDETTSASTGQTQIANKNKNNNKGGGGGGGGGNGGNKNDKNNNKNNDKGGNGGGGGGGGGNKNDKNNGGGNKNDGKNNNGGNKNTNGGKNNNNNGKGGNNNKNDKKDKKKKKKKKNRNNNNNAGGEEEVGEELEEGDEDLPPCEGVEEEEDVEEDIEDTDEDGISDEEDADDDGDGVDDEDEADEEDEEQPQVTEPTVPSMQFAVNIPGSAGLEDSRNLAVDFTDLNGNVVAQKSVPIQGFSDEMYIGFLEYGTIPSGIYRIRVKLPNSLRQRIDPEYQQIDITKDIDLPEVDLVMGDFDNNNILNILDVNIFLRCMDVTLFEEEEFEEETFDDDGEFDEEFEEDESETFGSGSFRILNTVCPQHALTDLNGDGIVNLLDYNILLESFQTSKG